MIKNRIIWTLFLFCTGMISLSAQSGNTKRLKVMCFNIRMSGEMAGYQASKFADLIKQYNPDLIAFQEVDFKVQRSGSKDILTEIADLTGMFPLFAKAIATGGGEYGVGMLTKQPVNTSSRVALPTPQGTKEARVALVADIRINSDFSVRFVSTHLDHSTAEVRSEMVAKLNSPSVISGNKPIVLGGDFNAKPTENSIATGMSNWQRICTNENTYPASAPTSKIDYIFAYPALKWKVNSYQVVKNDISDHCALIAEFEFLN